jgi:hypothetical protein
MAEPKLAAGDDADRSGAPPRHRPTRRPFGSMDQKLAWPLIPGFHLHWFNDVPGRIDRAKEAGYEHVKDADGKLVQRIVGVSNAGDGLVGFLMKIPQDWYEEDMKKEQDRIEQFDDDLRRGQIEGRNLDPKSDQKSKFYVGKQGITIKSGTGRA